jgi:hypothetical protein
VSWEDLNSFLGTLSNADETVRPSAISFEDFRQNHRVSMRVPNLEALVRLIESTGVAPWGQPNDFKRLIDDCLVVPKYDCGAFVVADLIYLRFLYIKSR